MKKVKIMKLKKDAGVSFIEVIIALAVLSGFLVYFTLKISDISLISSNSAGLEKKLKNNMPKDENSRETMTPLGKVDVYDEKDSYFRF